MEHFNPKSAKLQKKIRAMTKLHLDELSSGFNSSLNSLRGLIQQTDTSVKQSLKINVHLSEFSTAVSAPETERNWGMMVMSDQLENQGGVISNASASMNHMTSSIASLTN